MTSNVVLVTGGCGFLGQHVIKHLQLYADGVTEIRVFDIIPFKQKLDYDGKKTVSSVIGDITDKHVVVGACQGVNAVFHLVSKIDVSLFPDNNAMYDVNVKGTENIIQACQTQNVDFLVYCGTLGSFYGHEEVKNGTETSVKIPKKCAHGKYGDTKRIALEKVMAANDTVLNNGRKLKTIGLLPPGMYGELDPHFLRAKSRSVRNGIYNRMMGPMTAKIQYSYVGNVSMMFVQAYNTLRKTLSVSGQYYFAVDDTPAQSHIDFRRPFLREKVSVSSWYVPKSVLCCILGIIYYVLLLIRPFRSVNFPFSSDIINFINTTFYVTSNKARTLLGYKPLYDYDTAIERTKSCLYMN